MKEAYQRLLEIDPDETLPTQNPLNIKDVPPQPLASPPDARMVRQMTVDLLFQAARSVDTNTLVGRLVQQRFIALAHNEDPYMTRDNLRAYADWDSSRLSRGHHDS